MADLRDREVSVRRTSARRSWKILRSPRAACAEPARRHAGGAMKRAHEIREIAEADVERDIADRTRIVSEKSRGAAQAGADQILMRRHAEHAREHAQEMECAETGIVRGAIEIERLVRAIVDAKRGLDRAAAVARVHAASVAFAAGDGLDETAREQEPGFVQANVALPIARSTARARRAPSVPATAARRRCARVSRTRRANRSTSVSIVAGVK